MSLYAWLLSSLVCRFIVILHNCYHGTEDSKQLSLIKYRYFYVDYFKESVLLCLGVTLCKQLFFNTKYFQIKKLFDFVIIKMIPTAPNDFLTLLLVYFTDLFSVNIIKVYHLIFFSLFLRCNEMKVYINN